MVLSPLEPDLGKENIEVRSKLATYLAVVANSQHEPQEVDQGQHGGQADQAGLEEVEDLGIPPSKLWSRSNTHRLGRLALLEVEGSSSTTEQGRDGGEGGEEQEADTVSHLGQEIQGGVVEPHQIPLVLPLPPLATQPVEDRPWSPGHPQPVTAQLAGVVLGGGH